MAESYEVAIKCAYDNSDYERTYTFDVATIEELEKCQGKVQALNASLAAGTDGGLSAFFIAEDGSPLYRITEMQTRAVEETIIY